MIRPVVAPSSPDQERLATVRAGLPALAAGIYLDTAASGPLPAETTAAMADLAAWEASTGRAHPGVWPEMLVRMDEARASVAAVLTTDPGRVALTHGTAGAMRALIDALAWAPGDAIVATTLLHRDAIGALASLRPRGVDVRFVDVGDGSDGGRVVDVVTTALDGRVRLVVAPHVGWATGPVLPARALADLAHAHGARLAVDGSHAVGAIPTDIDALGVDAYALSARRWLLGPDGIGALAVRDDLLAAAPPSSGQAGWATLDADGTGTPQPDARRLEPGDLHARAVVGFARSISWLSMYVGLDWVLRRGRVVAGRLAEALAGTDGVTVLTPRPVPAAIVTFRIRGWSAPDALAELGSRAFVIARSMDALDAVRLSVGAWTTDEEVDRVVDAVGLLARHTPATLPPRRTLTILGER